MERDISSLALITSCDGERLHATRAAYRSESSSAAAAVFVERAVCAYTGVRLLAVVRATI